MFVAHTQRWGAWKKRKKRNFGLSFIFLNFKAGKRERESGCVDHSSAGDRRTGVPELLVDKTC